MSNGPSFSPCGFVTTPINPPAESTNPTQARLMTAARDFHRDGRAVCASAVHRLPTATDCPIRGRRDGRPSGSSGAVRRRRAAECVSQPRTATARHTRNATVAAAHQHAARNSCSSRSSSPAPSDTPRHARRRCTAEPTARSPNHADAPHHIGWSLHDQEPIGSYGASRFRARASPARRRRAWSTAPAKGNAPRIVPASCAIFVPVRVRPARTTTSIRSRTS